MNEVQAFEAAGVPLPPVPPRQGTWRYLFNTWGMLRPERLDEARRLRAKVGTIVCVGCHMVRIPNDGRLRCYGCR